MRQVTRRRALALSGTRALLLSYAFLTRRDSLREEGKVFLGAPLSFLRKVGEREGAFLLLVAEMVCLIQ